MSDIAIKVEGLGKRYHIGANQQSYKTLKEKLTDTAATPFRALRSLGRRNGHHSSNGHKSKAEMIWALKDVSFEIKRGEVVGIIGRNGAGKSTLLKILSRITEPTEGYADITGGMYVRLAFGVAAHLDPEILLVDEVLAVGDAAFQKKCLGKMGDVAREGRAVLFVSHNTSAVVSLCKRALLLTSGSISMDGPSTDVTASYQFEAAGLNLNQTTDLREVTHKG